MVPTAIYNRDIMSSFVSTPGSDLCFAQRQQLLSLDYGVGPTQLSKLGVGERRILIKTSTYHSNESNQFCFII